MATKAKSGSLADFPEKEDQRIGDIDVNNENGSAFEGVEIKHEIPITSQLVADAYKKFKVHNTDRYYLLTTANMDSADWDAIEVEVARISQIHRYQVIVNGVYTTLKYYLRLLTTRQSLLTNMLNF